MHGRHRIKRRSHRVAGTISRVAASGTGEQQRCAPPGVVVSHLEAHPDTAPPALSLLWALVVTTGPLNGAARALRMRRRMGGKGHETSQLRRVIDGLGVIYVLAKSLLLKI